MDVQTDNLGKLKVLLVEDHPDSARAMARLLRTFGHDVQVAHDLGEATLKADDYAFDLLISDIHLPDGSGLDFMRQLRTARPAVKAIALTGLADSSDVKACLEAGFDSHVAKPVDFTKLRQTITQIVHAS